MNYNDLSFFHNNLDKVEKYNTCTDYIGYYHFRILKTFKSTASPSFKGPTFENTDHEVTHDLLDKFPLRFYLPAESLARKSRGNTSGDLPDPRIEHLVIMVNGLDEHEEYFLKQYDYLGASFAEQNIGSVLLSTPLHLHRTVKYRKRDVENSIEPSVQQKKNTTKVESSNLRIFC